MKQIKVIFATYADFCTAFQVDTAISEKAVYKDQRTKQKTLVAVQVSGTTFEIKRKVNTARYLCLERNFKILLSPTATIFEHQNLQ